MYKHWWKAHTKSYAARQLAALGFPRCHNVCEDFYARCSQRINTILITTIITLPVGLTAEPPPGRSLAAGDLPPHDVVVTNPPYSADHLPRVVRYLAGSGGPWLLLVPNYVYNKEARKARELTLY